MIKHKKPESFYSVYDRKPTSQGVTHYCPGCGHGTVHKLIAEALDDFKLQDRTVFCSPVGCSVFAYYYFDTGNVQCSHGRAPAVATGLRRALDDAIVISYQGDGDLAGIGTTEIIHAANRGENITVFFVNNAIYGMTGGQMAPTTLVGQKTMTTPLGRDSMQDGTPIGMAEVISALKAPVFVERCSLGRTASLMKTRKAIRKALQNQVDKKGFSFVEILAPCPINWKMDSKAARKWLIENLEPNFPVKNFTDKTDDVEKNSAVFQLPWLDDQDLHNLFHNQEQVQVKEKGNHLESHFVKFGGFGGQGVMVAGILLANSAVAEGVNATWLPSYGPEMRGGTANASVIVSEDTIGSPVVESPNILIAMNAPSLDAFEKTVTKDGYIFVNSSIVDRKVERSDVQVFYIPATDIAKEEGLLAAANIVMLTVYVLATNIISLDTLKKTIPINLKKKELLEKNLKLLDRAVEYYEKHLKK